MKLNALKEFALTIPGGDGPVEIVAPENIPSGVDAPSNVIQVAFSLLFIVGIIAAVIFAIYAGVLWATSSGDKTKIDRARRTLLFSIIGVIVMTLAFVIVQTIGTILGSEYLSNFGIGESKVESGIQTPADCAASGGTCATGLNCAAGETGIGVCSDSPVQACCK